MEIFEYAFMRRAFIVGILLAAVIPCIGLVIVCKRLSMIGDALSHTSLAGVAAGLILGLNPVLTAAAACVVAAIGIEAIRRKIPRFSEMSIAIIMSAGIGLAGVLSVLCVTGRTKRQAGRGARKDSELSVYCFNRGDSFCRCKDGGGSHRLIHDGGSRGLRHAVWNELPPDAYLCSGV